MALSAQYLIILAAVYFAITMICCSWILYIGQVLNKTNRGGMKKVIVNLGVVLLLLVSASGYAQQTHRASSSAPYLDCERMTELARRSVELTSQGNTMAQTLDQLLPSSSHMSDEIFVMLAVMMLSDSAENTNWSVYQENCVNRRDDMVDAVNTICSGFGDVVELAVDARNAGNKTERQTGNFAINSIRREFGGAQSEEWRIVNPIVERIVRREVHAVYTSRQVRPDTARRDLERRCILR